MCEDDVRFGLNVVLLQYPCTVSVSRLTETFDLSPCPSLLSFSFHRHYFCTGFRNLSLILHLLPLLSSTNLVTFYLLFCQPHFLYFLLSRLIYTVLFQISVSIQFGSMCKTLCPRIDAGNGICAGHISLKNKMRAYGLG